MVLSEEAESALLDELSRAKAVELAPVSVYVMLMMLLGLCGNVMVCAFYSQRARITPTTRLIVAVAVIDTAICVLMPKNVVDISLSYKFTSSTLCKLNNFINHTTALSSAMVLVAVAAFRFRAVCRPFSSQFSLRHANIAIVISVAFSLLSSVPVLVTHESVAINVTVNPNLKITGYDCNTSKKASLKPLNLFVNVLHFFIFIGTTATFVSLYGKMGHSIFKYYRRKKSLTDSVPTSVKSTSEFTTELESECPAHKDDTNDDKTKPADSSDSGVDESGIDSSTEMVDKPDALQSQGHIVGYTNSADPDKINIALKEIAPADDAHLPSDHDTNNDNTEVHNETRHAVTFDEDYTKSEDHVKPKRIAADKKEEHKFSGVAVKQTAMLSIITVIFVLSFLPYLGMNISRTLSKNKDGDEDFTNWIQFCTRSYLINSAANPFVYGLFNTEFRAFVKKVLCRCCPR